MADIFEIAGWFRSKAPMDHKKIQKLCYYAQAWSLVLNGGVPMFDGGDDGGDGGEFEAWAQGPVSRRLWDRLEMHGYLEVPAEALPDAGGLSERERYVLDRVWDTYGDMTGFQLEDLAKEEEPWRKARGSTPLHAPSTAVISRDDMRGYYERLYLEGGDDGDDDDA